MKLKKFNEMNESLDRNDGYNILTENVKKNVKKLLNDIEDDVINDSMNLLLHTKLDNESDNQFSYEVHVILEKDFTNIIREYIRDFVEDGIRIEEERDSRTTMLEFEDGDDKFIIPLITTMSGDDMIYEDNNKLKYGVWINTYVAKKV